MNGGRAILFLSLCCVPALLSAKTRQDVISDAAEYASYSWPVEKKNLRDVLRCDQGAMIADSEGDGLDDRGQVGSTQTATCAYYPSLWPFVIGSTVTGEAYGFGVKDSSATFVSRIKSGLKWIAGKKDGDSFPAGFDYKGFTGVDCSGFISRIFELPKPLYTDVARLKEYSVPVQIKDLKKGDWLLYFGGKYNHSVIFGSDNFSAEFLSADAFSETASIIHATPNDYFTNTHKRRVISESPVFSRESERLYILRANAGEREHFGYSPFPQFRWVTPSTGTAAQALLEQGTVLSTGTMVMDPLDQRVVLRVLSGSSVAVSGLALTFDAGLPSSFTVRAGAEGFGVTPPADSASLLVSYSVPGERWLSPGTHTVTAQAANLLGLEDSGLLEFTVPGGTAPPRVSWEDSGPALVMAGMLHGSSNTLATAPWFHTGNLRLRVDGGSAVLGSLAVYPSDEAEEPAYNKSFMPGTRSAVIGNALNNFGDATGYYTLAADALGNAATFYFHLDKTGPVIESTFTARLDAAGTGLVFDAAGQARDELSGIDGEVVRLAAGEALPPYAGPAYPPGPRAVPFSFVNLSNNDSLAVFDRSGWPAYYNIGVTTVAARLSASTHGPGDGVAYTAGVSLNFASMTVHGLADPTTGIRFIDPPQGMKAELWADSAYHNLIPDVPVIYAYPRVGSQKLLELTAASTVTAALNLMLHNTAGLRLESLPNSNTGQMQVWRDRDDDGDGEPDGWVDSAYSSGTFRLAADASAAGVGVNLFVLRHFNQWMPPGPIQRLQAGPVEVTIRDIVTGGNITVDTARRTLLQPGYKMAGEDLIYEIKTTAVSTQPIEIAIDYCNYSHDSTQRDGGRIVHCEEGAAACEMLPEVLPHNECRVMSKTTSLSPFGVMVPISDSTPPRTGMSFIGASALTEDGLWVSTETYLALSADDEAVKGDISGVARTLLT